MKLSSSRSTFVYNFLRFNFVCPSKSKVEEELQWWLLGFEREREREREREIRGEEEELGSANDT